MNVEQSRPIRIVGGGVRVHTVCGCCDGSEIFAEAARDGGPAVQVDERGAWLAVPLVRAGPSFRPPLLLHGIDGALFGYCVPDGYVSRHTYVHSVCMATSVCQPLLEWFLVLIFVLVNSLSLSLCLPLSLSLCLCLSVKGQDEERVETGNHTTEGGYNWNRR